MYRHDVNYISEPNGRCCFLKGAHSSRKAKQLGTRNEWIWGYMGVQGLTTCPVLARGATSRGEALAAHTPQAAPSYRGSATLHWGHETWQCCPPSSSSSTCQGQEELNLGNFPPTHTQYFLSLLELLGLCTSGSIHSQQFRFSFFPSLGDTFPESCCRAWPRCQQDRAPGSPNSLIPTVNTQLGFKCIASESSRSPH